MSINREPKTTWIRIIWKHQKVAKKLPFTWNLWQKRSRDYRSRVTVVRNCLPLRNKRIDDIRLTIQLILCKNCPRYRRKLISRICKLRKNTESEEESKMENIDFTYRVIIDSL